MPLPQDPGPASRSLTHPAFASPRDATNGFRSDRTVSPAPGPDPAASVQLVLLDFGLAEELTPVVRHHFISFLHHLMRGRAGRLGTWAGRLVAYWLHGWAGRMLVGCAGSHGDVRLGRTICRCVAG